MLPVPVGTPSSSAASPLSDALAVVLPVLCLCTILMPGVVVPYLALIPAHTMLRHVFVWNVVSHVLIESNVLLLVLAIAANVFWGREVEAAWGTRALATLYLATVCSTSVVVIVATTLETGFKGSVDMYRHFEGFGPCVMALAVAQWNRRGHDALLGTSGGSGTVRICHLPLLAAALCVVLHFVLGVEALTEEEAEHGVMAHGSRTLPALVGGFAAWFYLRFIRPTTQLRAMAPTVAAALATDANGSPAPTVRPVTTVNGDPSPHFALDAAFPAALQPLVRAVGTLVFPVVRFVGLGDAVADASSLRPSITVVDSASPAAVIDPSTAGTGTMRPLPGTSAADAERRRQIALAALTQRLEKAKQAEAAGASSNDADAGSPSGVAAAGASTGAGAKGVELSLDM